MAKNRRRQLRELYARVPQIACKGECWDSCGPIEMTPLEERILNERSVVIPPRAEALEVLRATGDFTCPALVDRRCSVYDVRPMICRVWGVSESLRCPYGCEAQSVLTDEDAFVLLMEANNAGGSPDALHPEEIRRAMREHGDVVRPWLDANRPTDQRGSR